MGSDDLSFSNSCHLKKLIIFISFFSFPKKLIVQKKQSKGNQNQKIQIRWDLHYFYYLNELLIRFILLFLLFLSNTFIKNPKIMITEGEKISDAKVQSLSLKFTFITEKDKLIINAQNSKDHQQYVGEISANPYTDFQDIKEILQEGQFKILVKTQNLLKIKIGATPLELVPTKNSQTNEFKETISKLKQKHTELQEIIKQQKGKVERHQELIALLTKEVKGMKESEHNSNVIIGELIQNFNFTIKELKENFKREMNEMQLRLRNVNISKTSQISQKVDVEAKISQKEQTPDLNCNSFSQSKKVITEKDEEQEEQKSPILSIQKGEINQQTQLSKQQQKDPIQKINHMLILKLTEDPKIQNQQKKVKLNKSDCSFQWDRWQLMANNLFGESGFIAKVEDSNQTDFGLAYPAFTRQVKQIQRWFIKISNKKGWISLGICLRNQVQKNDFNTQKIKLKDIGHGCYLIGTGGVCWSHSSKDFNDVGRSFKFWQKDYIYVEYDPIAWQLRFRHNRNGARFTLPIVPPPQGDAYHPCVGIRFQGSCVELGKSKVILS